MFAGKAISRTQFKSIILLLWLMESFFESGARFVFHNLGFSSNVINIAEFASGLIPFILLLFYIPHIKNKKRAIGIATAYLVIVLAFVVTYFVFPDCREYFAMRDYGVYRVFNPGGAIYAIMMFGLIDDIEDIKKVFKIFAYLQMANLIIVNMAPALIKGHWSDISSLGTMVDRPYSLSFGYSMAVPVMILLWMYIREKKIINLILGIVGWICIFWQGSRGALMIPAAYLIIMLITETIHEGANAKNRKRLAIGGGVIVALLLLIKPISKGLAKLLAIININSRTLSAIADGNLGMDNGRFEIWASVIGHIKTNRLLGCGVFGDRPEVVKHHYVGYAHNIFLELIASFGIFGLIVCIVIIAISIYMLIKCKDRNYRDIFIILLAASLQLLISSSFWYTWEFWAMLVIFVKYVSYKRQSVEKAEA